jgi:hypothetical protein
MKNIYVFLDRSKQAKMHWLQDPNQSNVDNINTVRREASRHYRNKKKEYLKAKVVEIETYRKLKNIRDLYRGISDFKKGYQSRTNTVKDEKRDFVIDCHSFWDKWRKHFSQLFNEHGISDLRQGQADIHTAELQVLEPSAFEVEMAIETVKRQ